MTKIKKGLGSVKQEKRRDAKNGVASGHWTEKKKRGEKGGSQKNQGTLNPKDKNRNEKLLLDKRKGSITCDGKASGN